MFARRSLRRMQTPDRQFALPSPTPRRKLNRETVSVIGDLLPACDFGAVLLAAYLATLTFATWFEAGTTTAFEGVRLTALAGPVAGDAANHVQRTRPGLGARPLSITPDAPMCGNER